MVDSVQPAPPAPFDPTAGLAGSTPDLAGPTQRNTIDSNGFLAAILSPDTEPLQEADNAQNNSNSEGLLDINSDTLSLLNEVGSEPRSATITGNLNSEQMHDLGVLKQDAQRLEEASIEPTHIPLTSGATTVDLSLTAQEIVAGTGVVPATAPLAPPTTAQLAQMAQIVAPFTNQPLTPAVVGQIQAQFVANQLSPLFLSMSTLLLMQNFIASMQPAPREVIVTEEEYEHDDETVEAVSSTDKVAAEGNAILA